MMLPPTNTPLIDVGLATLLGIGTTLVLSVTPWFRRRSPIARLAPYVPRAGAQRGTATKTLGLRGTLEPILDWIGSKVSAALGVVTDLETRLRRAGREVDPYRFRLQQMVLALGGLVSGLIIWLSFNPRGPITLFTLVGLPVLAVLGVEQSLSRAIEARQARLTAELPVIVEQLGMLVSAGFSLTSAISHISGRGSGVVADDLRDVTAEIRRGVAPVAAFEAWAQLSGLGSVERVVAVLALNSEAADLGSLISAEARSIRSETHRTVIESIERRAQLVWIPVTVATLVPGLIFLAVPFYSAMSQITGG